MKSYPSHDLIVTRGVRLNNGVVCAYWGGGALRTFEGIWETSSGILNSRHALYRDYVMHCLHACRQAATVMDVVYALTQ